ncbi:MAG: DegV family protein [Bacilli bacterium]|nr:DegV family protein [Bacilli bacterium]
MNKIGLLLDSTTLTRLDLNEYDFIKFVQLKVQVDHETFDENQLTSSEMEQYIDEGKKFLTSQPSPAEFLEAFKQFHNEGYTHVVVVVLSHKLSGTYQSALIAKSMTDCEMEIDVHGPKTASFGLALGAKQLAETIKGGADIDAINARYHSIFQDPLISFTLGDLTHLYHGGRLNRVQAFIGKILRIKPVIEMVDGKLELVEKKRKNIDCFDHFVNKIKSYVSKYKKVYLDIINLNMEEWSTKLLEFVKENFKNIDIHLTDFVSPVFYSHLGNKGFGISIVAE